MRTAWLLPDLNARVRGIKARSKIKMNLFRVKLVSRAGYVNPRIYSTRYLRRLRRDDFPEREIDFDSFSRIGRKPRPRCLPSCGTTLFMTRCCHPTDAVHPGSGIRERSGMVPRSPPVDHWFTSIRRLAAIPPRRCANDHRPRSDRAFLRENR